MDLDWKNLPKKSSSTAVISKRKIHPDYKALLEELEIQNPEDGIAITNPYQRYFRIKGPDEVLNKLPAKVPQSEKEELKKNWANYYFGMEDGEASAFNTAETTFSSLKSTEILSLLTSSTDNSFSEHNLYALKDVQERASLIAQTAEAYGSKKDNNFKNNSIILVNIPQTSGVQAFTAPTFIAKTGKDDQSAPTKTQAPSTPKKKQR